MDSSLVMQLQQAFMHSQLSKQRLSPPEITHYPLVLFGDERYGQLSPNLVPSARMQETVEFHKISEDKMNSTAYQEDDSDIPVDPVLGYISDMLMDEDMEDRRCMFVDSSAYRAMADELAGLLGDSSASSDPQLASHSFLVEGITSPSLEDCRPSVASLDIVKESSEGLYDEILRDPMTKEIADMIDSDSSAFREYPRRDIGSTTARKYFLMDNDSLNTRDCAWRENDLSFPINEYPLRGKCSVEEKKLSDSGIKKLQTEFVESCYLPQAKRPSPIAALSQLPAYAPETIKLASPASSFSSSICQEHSSPSSTISELNDGHGYGLPDLAKPYRANGREDLFKLLQKSVASHVGKGKQKEAEGRYSPLGRTRSQESKSFQERSGSRHNVGKLQRAPSGRYLQQSPGLSSDGDGDSVRLKYTIGVRSSKKSSPSNEIQLWSVGEPIGEEETPHGAEQHEGVGESSDVLSLLTRCAQAIAGNNIRQANEIVREIRKEATPFGDGKQRLAYYFMEALVARISGTGGCLYTALNNRRYSAAEMLKAYQLRIEKCPFIRISHFFSNQTIANACDGESRLHVVDYGILYGFQWPSLIQTLANRPGGPPRLRITGIDFPQPGIKPSERVEDTGRRLSEFAQSCGVPFEYHSLAVTKWEDIQPSSLFLRHDEVLAINCMFRLRNLLDETVMAESPRNKLLARIRSMQPKVFVEAEVNAGYNAPFSFMARFREALAHFDNVYDAIDSCVTRDHPDRRLLEQEIFGREILNVVACEGLERVERAEQYKHWQWRTQKSGFEMLPLDRNICNKSKLLMHQYHKDYNLAEDGGWLMVGWRGRFSRCMSAWKPALFS